MQKAGCSAEGMGRPGGGYGDMGGEGSTARHCPLGLESHGKKWIHMLIWKKPSEKKGKKKGSCK